MHASTCYHSRAAHICDTSKKTPKRPWLCTPLMGFLLTALSVCPHVALQDYGIAICVTCDKRAGKFLLANRRKQLEQTPDLRGALFGFAWGAALLVQGAAARGEGLLGPAKGGYQHLRPGECIIQECCRQASFCVWWLLKLILECIELHQGMDCTFGDTVIRWPRDQSASCQETASVQCCFSGHLVKPNPRQTRGHQYSMRTGVETHIFSG